MNKPTLSSRLARLRRRVLLIGATSGFLWALFVVVLVLLLSVWLDLLWELEPTLRIASVAVACGAGAVLLAGAIYKAFDLSRDRLVVRRLDAASETGGQIVSGWELMFADSSDPRLEDKPITRGLARMAVNRASDLVDRVPAQRAVSSRPARVSMMSLLLALAFVVVLTLCLPSLARTQWRRFTNPYGDVPPFSRIEFEVRPGDTEVVYGSGMDVEAKVEGAPVDQVELVLVDGREEETLPMFPQADGRWRAVLARITNESEYYVRADRARSERYKIRVITTPNIEQVRFRIIPPAYTRDATYEGTMPEGGVAGLPGTRIEVTVASNRPLSGGTLRIISGSEPIVVSLGPVVPGEAAVAGEMTLVEDGKFEIRVVDIAGQPSRESFGGTIVKLEDERPLVRLIEPKEQSFATPTADLPVTLVAEDDYGVSRLQLYRSLNDSRPAPLELPVSDPPARRVRSRVFLPLADYGLEPGDEIKLFARVEDNDPAGKKGSESQVVTVRIISQEQFERMLRVREGMQVLLAKYQKARRRGENLAEEIEGLRKKIQANDFQSGETDEARQKASEAIRRELESLSHKLRQDSREIDEAVRHLLPYDVDKNKTRHLERMASELKKMAESLDKLAQRSDLDNELADRKLAEIAAELMKERQQFEQQAMIPLEHLELVYPLIENQSEFVMLVARQVDISQRLAEFKVRQEVKDPGQRIRIRDLEDEQRRIRESLDTLLDDIEQNAQRLPDEEQFEQLRVTALRFVDEVRASGANEALADAEAALADFHGDRGWKKAVEAADILKRFLKDDCPGGQFAGACKGCLKFQPGLASDLGLTIEQLLAEAGLAQGAGPGGGFGVGPGNGYSSRRGMNNMALYGARPSMGASSQSQSGMGQGDSQDGLAGGGANELEGSEAAIVESKHSAAAGGAGQGAAPLRYRRSVSKYLRRIAEETGR